MDLDDDEDFDDESEHIINSIEMEMKQKQKMKAGGMEDESMDAAMNDLKGEWCFVEDKVE